MNKSIAFCARKTGGKNTAANMAEKILAEHGIQSLKFAFADRLKQEIAEALNVSRVEIENNKAFYRPILQWYGTDFKRIHQGRFNYWVEFLMQDVKYYYLDYPDAVSIITDCRFPNEYEALVKELGTKFVWIERDVKSDNTSVHVSETSFKKENCSIILENNGTMQELKEQVHATLKLLKLI